MAMFSGTGTSVVGKPGLGTFVDVGEFWNWDDEMGNRTSIVEVDSEVSVAEVGIGVIAGELRIRMSTEEVGSGMLAEWLVFNTLCSTPEDRTSEEDWTSEEDRTSEGDGVSGVFVE